MPLDMVTMTHPDETNKFDEFVCIFGVLLHHTHASTYTNTIFSVVCNILKGGKIHFSLQFYFLLRYRELVERFVIDDLSYVWFYHCFGCSHAHRWHTHTHMGISGRVMWTVNTFDFEVCEMEEKSVVNFQITLDYLGFFFVWKWGMRAFVQQNQSIFLCGNEKWDFDGTINQIDV